MSHEIYINLKTVITNPMLFELKPAYNVGIEDAIDAVLEKDPNWYWAEQCLRPVLLCKFGARNSWRYVTISGDANRPRSLKVPAGGAFRTWFMEWLQDHNIQYEIHVDSHTL